MIDLRNFVKRIIPKATMNNLVVQEREKRQLHNIITELKLKKKSYVIVLFVGEDKTSKTMAAEVLANKLHLDLYKIDLSTAVSKYIGETEKNLRRVFDEAEGGGAILFFDEADALFGKRTEVRDSHDRHANIEISYLLQRMESYKGLAILAIKQKSSVDSAFLRRIRFIVDFPFPDENKRRRIWKRAFLQT